jgi:hypothetical protein
LPNLKKFLKGDTGAITYRNVEINFVHGRTATMTILKDGNEVERIILSDYENQGEEAMHGLFREKGFEQLSDEELRKKLADRDEKEREDEMMRSKMAEERRAAYYAALEEKRMQKNEETINTKNER